MVAPHPGKLLRYKGGVLMGRFIRHKIHQPTLSLTATAETMWVTYGLLVVFTCLLCQVQSACNYKIVCYFPNWFQYKPAPYRYVPANIDPHLCTHIFYAFVQVSPDAKTIVKIEPNDETMYAEIIALKNQNPDLKVLLAVGGWNHGPGRFSRVAATDSSIDLWAGNVIAYLRQHRFDGLDVDWEYPVGRGSPASDKQRFTVFLQRVRAAFDAEAVRTGTTRLDLAIAVSAGKWFGDQSYERSKIGRYVDLVNVMTYDFHGTWERTAGHQSQLYSSKYDKGANVQLNAEFAIDYYISGGVPKEKLILGMASYGRTFTLTDPTKTTPGSPASGGGYRGDYTHETGILSYFEICNVLKMNGWTKVLMSKAKVPYAYGPRNGKTEWIGYDDEASFVRKMKYLQSKGLGGAMVWNLALDDFNGKSCGSGNSPLIRIIKNQLCPNNSTSASPTASTNSVTTASTTPVTTASTAPVTTADSTSSTSLPVTVTTTTATETTKVQTTKTPTPQTISVSNIEVSCKRGEWPGEWLADPTDCSKFYRCVTYTSALRIMYSFNCPHPQFLGFDMKKNLCNWKSLVPACAAK